MGPSYSGLIVLCQKKKCILPGVCGFLTKQNVSVLNKIPHRNEEESWVRGHMHHTGFFQVHQYHSWHQTQGRFIQLRIYTSVVSFYPSVTSLVRFHKANSVAPSDKHVDFRGTRSNRGSVVLVAFFKDDFSGDQVESPFCLIVHFLHVWWGSMGHLQLRVSISLLLLYWLSNSQLTVCPLDPGWGGEKSLCVLCVLTPSVAQRSQILKQGLRVAGVAKISPSSLPLTPGWDSFLNQNNKLLRTQTGKKQTKLDFFFP